MPPAPGNTWRDLFHALPDPRQRRGQRFAWWVLLTLIAAALLSDQAAMSQWVQEHADDLRQQVWPTLPSDATLRRTLQRWDVAAWEQQIRERASQQMPVSVDRFQAHAFDGKTLRGAGRHGHLVHLVSEVEQRSGLVLWQQAVTDKSNEIPLVQQMLAGRDLPGHVCTFDALHTQRETATLIVQQGGHYVMVVKENQPMLAQALREWFAEPAWPEE